MRRRLGRWLVVGAALVCFVDPAWAQHPARIPVVGVLRTASAGADDTAAQSMLRAFGAYGYIEGQNIGIEQRFAAGRADRLPALAQELVRLKVDVIVATTEAALRAAMQATSTIPIVVVAYDHDPVASGFIRSLSRPEANVTGIVSRQVELAGKRLELLKEALPGVSRVAVISDRTARRAPPDLYAAAGQLELGLQPLRIDGKRELDSAFERARQDATAALLVFSVVFHEQRSRIAKLALDAGMPIMAPERDFVVAGALMSYAPDRDGVMERVAYFVDRLLHGAKVQELPVERAENFKLSVNLKTAKALGVQLPESILLRADEVIR